MSLWRSLWYTVQLLEEAIQEAGSDRLEDVCASLELIAADRAGSSRWESWLARKGIRTTGDVKSLLRLRRALLEGDVDAGGVILEVASPPPPLLNAQERMHWGQRRRLRERWRELARMAWLEAGAPRFRRPRVTVRLFYPTHRPRDPDNAAAAVKPILDGLKGVAWQDDDAGTVELRVELHVDRQRPRVEVLLEERDGPLDTA